MQSQPFSSAVPNPIPCSVTNLKQKSIRQDLYKAFHLLRRSSKTKQFMLSKPCPQYDLNILACNKRRPSFTISTEEIQLGTLSGQIGLKYLGIPSFSNIDGLSGGLIVTTYAKRTHPLHHPSVMSNLRVGHYVRDNQTGEWCMITRNYSDGILRLQYMNVNSHGIIRERIGLTCSISLFDSGQFIQSVLYKCHDYEHKLCQFCLSINCSCTNKMNNNISIHNNNSNVNGSNLGLDTVAKKVVLEGANHWLGTVRVTVVNNFTNNPKYINVDDTMTVRSTYQPSIDKQLESSMKELAIIETISHSMNVPAPLPTDNETSQFIEDEYDSQQQQQDKSQEQQQGQQPNIDDLSAMLMFPPPTNQCNSNEINTNQLVAEPTSRKSSYLHEQQQKHGQKPEQEQEILELTPILQTESAPLELSPLPLSPALPSASVIVTTPDKTTDLSFENVQPTPLGQAYESPVQNTSLLTCKNLEKLDEENKQKQITKTKTKTIEPTDKSNKSNNINNNTNSNNNKNDNNNNSNTMLENLTFDDVFLPSYDDEEFEEVANHFLIPHNTESTHVIHSHQQKEESFIDDDFPMLPADPSTLPGGIETCMDGMDVGDECYYDDDCFSLMTSDRDTRSCNSALSTAGSDYAPKLDSVPLPGDDVVDGFSALNLDSHNQSHKSHDNVIPPSPSSKDNKKNSTEKETKSKTKTKTNKAVQQIEKVTNDNDDSDEAISEVEDAMVVELELINDPMNNSKGHLTKHNSISNMSEIDNSNEGSLHNSSSNNNLNIELKKENQVQEETIGSSTNIDTTVSNEFNEQSRSERRHEIQETQRIKKVKSENPLPTVSTSESRTCEQKQQAPLKKEIKTEQREATTTNSCCTTSGAMPITFATAVPTVIPGAAATTVFGGFSTTPGSTVGQVATPTMMALPVAGGGAVVLPSSTFLPTGAGTGTLLTAPTIIPTATPTWMLPTTGNSSSSCNTTVQQQQQQQAMMMMMMSGNGAPRLAPRPAGVGPGMSMYGGNNTRLMMAMEKERKAEERRKKNRQAAARSNARKKDLMDGIKAEIQKSKHRKVLLQAKHQNLKSENSILKQQLKQMKNK